MEFNVPGIPLTVALAAVATLGYVFGRRTRRDPSALSFGARRELRRAKVVANQLEAIAEHLRKDLAAHHLSITRFQERVAALSSDQQETAWHELCREAEEILKPTMRLAAQLAQSYDEIRQQSNHLMTFTEARTDPLTGVNNRRALDESIDMMFAAMARYDAPFSLAIFDIDHFKRVNDEHGHLHGDRVLREIARVIHDNVRETDIVTRYGGEEFVVVMPHTPLDGAVMFSERLRAAIAQKTILTMSGGVAQAIDGDNHSTLLGRADAALYGAKAAGRNCVFYHNGETVLPISEFDTEGMIAAEHADLHTAGDPA
jgi:diguanylate cyclase